MKKITIISIIIVAVITFYSCTKESAEPTPQQNQVILITQQQLNAATIVNQASDTLIIGNPFLEREEAARNNFRDILTNFSRNKAIQPGNIIVIRNFTNNKGSRGSFLFTDVMVKRELGFNPSGNDFEYMRIPFDSTTNYTLNPNGLLPQVSNLQLRGLGINILSVNCVTCHNRTNDFVFFN